MARPFGQEKSAKRKATTGDNAPDDQCKPPKKAKTMAGQETGFVLPEPKPRKPVDRSKDELAKANAQDVENKYAVQ